jgi:hypothetical protein
MIILPHRWKRRLRWGEVIFLLAVLTALLALAMSYVMRSYYGQDPKGYSPFDSQRERQIQQKDSSR